MSDPAGLGQRSPSVAFELPDINVLVALTSPAHQRHQQAHAWLDTVPAFATTAITEAGLIRLLLNPVVMGQRVTGRQAVTVLEEIRAQDRAVFIPDSSSLASAAIDLIGLVGHQQVTGQHLVNLVAGHGGALVTFDRRIRTALATSDQSYVRVL